MNLKHLTFLVLSSILIACGGNENSEENDLDITESSEIPEQFNAEADLNLKNQVTPTVLDTVSATGILVDDLSYMHGIAFAQRLMRERITFIDATELGAVFLEFEKGTKTAVKPEDASKKLRALSKETQNFQKISINFQKKIIVRLFLSQVALLLETLLFYLQTVSYTHLTLPTKA